MDINIKVTDIYDTVNIVKENLNKYRILSITGKSSEFAIKKIDFKEEIKKAKDHLWLSFDDATAEFTDVFKRKTILATTKDCQKAVDFIDKGGDVIVHCHAGISRSTAMVLGYFMYKGIDYKSAVEKLLEIRPNAKPNMLILNLFCEMLNFSLSSKEIIDYLYKVKVEKYNINTNNDLKPYFLKEQYRKPTSE